MREFLYVILILVSVVIFYKLYKKVKGDLFILFWAGLIYLMVFGGLLKGINLVTIPEEVRSAITEVREEVGSTESIRINSNDEIEVLIDEEWINTSEIEIVKNLTGSITIDYEGREIKIVDSGVVSTIKVLKKLKIVD